MSKGTVRAMNENGEARGNPMSKGLTLVELVMVLAVLAIIGAILVPNFLSTTGKARLKSDIQSAKVIQSAMDLYQSERGKDAANGSNSVTEVVNGLITDGYIKKGSVAIQTAGAAWVISGEKVVMVNIGSATDKAGAIAAYNQLNDLDKLYVTGASGAGSSQSGELTQPDGSAEQGG